MGSQPPTRSGQIRREQENAHRQAHAHPHHRGRPRRARDRNPDCTGVRAVPDSRPYYRGADPALAPKSPSPDDRAFSRAIPVSSKTIIVSPDDRAFARSSPVEPSALAASVSVQPRGFNWTDALIGGTFGLVLALLGGAAVAIALHHRRGVLRTA